MKKRVGILTSGGDCPGLNATIRGVAKALYARMGDNVEIVGILNGYSGLINGDYKEMCEDDFRGILTLGGTILGTKRTPFKMMRVVEDDNIDKVAAMKKTYKEAKLDCLLCLGGNGTHKTANLLSQEGLNIIGLPKTIDNDLCITDHTPGFGSAAKYVATTMQEIIRDSSVYSIPSVTIVEIMGRHAGWLTASSAVLHAYGEPAPHLVYVPETHFSAERFLHDVEQEMAKHKAVIVAVSEGVSVPEGVQSGLVDNFGHKYLSGIGKYLEQLVRDTFGCKVRSVELNVMQRCSSHLSSKTDIDEAEQIGAAGVQCALRGETGRVMIFRRIHNKPYTVVMEPADASQIANREKFLPREFLTPAGNNISDEAMSYFLPLIQGELNLMMRGGIPMHFTIQESVLK